MHALSVPAKLETPRHAHERLARALLHGCWITALCLWATYRVGRFGFSPTDQGFILGLSWRILHGEIPHRDLISARPLGSALLHTVDLLLPGPLFLVSLVLAMFQIILTAIALAVLVTRRPLLTWGPVLTGVVAAACLLNLHTKGLAAWHTIDGLMLAACGFWALDAGLRSGKTFPRRLGLLMIGFAPLAKQSFAFAMLVAVAVLLFHPSVRVVVADVRRRMWPPGRRSDLLFLVAPGLLYVAVVALAGGLRDMYEQLTDARPTVAERLFLIWVERPGIIAVMVVCGLLLVAARTVADRGDPSVRVAEVGLVVVLAVLGVQVMVDGELTRAGDWAIELFWLAALACLVSGVSRRQIPWTGLFVLLLAWMCSLSWGADSPTLLGGTLLLTALYLIGADLDPKLASAQPVRRVEAGLVLGATGLTVIVLSGHLLTKAHDADPYRDRPQGQLTEDLGAVVPSMWRVRTNVDTATYIEQIKDCVQRHPANRVAVLPDNAFVYPALALRNPFPIDWPRPLELVADVRERMLATADRLNVDGDYLLLFQTVNARTGLGEGERVPDSIPENAEIIDYGGLEHEILSRMSGSRFTCGSFVGVWSASKR